MKAAGDIGSENADISSVKECEKHSHQKSKGSYVKLICVGLVGS